MCTKIACMWRNNSNFHWHPSLYFVSVSFQLYSHTSLHEDSINNQSLPVFPNLTCFMVKYIVVILVEMNVLFCVVRKTSPLYQSVRVGRYFSPCMWDMHVAVGHTADFKGRICKEKISHSHCCIKYWEAFLHVHVFLYGYERQHTCMQCVNMCAHQTITSEDFPSFWRLRKPLMVITLTC